MKIKVIIYIFITIITSMMLFSFTLEPTDGGPDAWTINKGRKLYMNKCGSCHRLSNEDGISPGLENVTKRQSKEEIIGWAINHKDRINSGDEYAKELYKKYNYYSPSKSGLNPLTAGYIYDFLYSLDNDGL